MSILSADSLIKVAKSKLAILLLRSPYLLGSTPF
uniref:Uncharacterized protein n=1 Tax=Podoviridae sp. ct8Lf7 TaxID=2827723 RepID=A0A8S5S1X8_9CAUD|nr:MAG TPA: hypothetical protein [Podoviridae sp. ct8Lf7]